MKPITPIGHAPYADILTLTTDRLILRAYRLADLIPLSQMWATPETTRFIGNQPRSAQDIWKQMQRMIGSWSLLGYGYWAVTLKDTGAVIGEAGFMEGLRDLDPALTGTPEAGWVIAPDHWNKGYATEILVAIHSWSDAHVPEKRTVCIIEPAHAASIHIAQKVGYKLRHEAQLASAPINIYERLG